MQEDMINRLFLCQTQVTFVSQGEPSFFNTIQLGKFLLYSLFFSNLRLFFIFLWYVWVLCVKCMCVLAKLIFILFISLFSYDLIVALSIINLFSFV